MVIDYRNLNAKTKTSNYPIPHKILKIRQIQGYNYFSKFDCKSGFYHLKLEEESKVLVENSNPKSCKRFPKVWKRRCMICNKEFSIIDTGIGIKRMRSIIYIIGLIVVIAAVLSLIGLI